MQDFTPYIQIHTSISRPNGMRSIGMMATNSMRTIEIDTDTTIDEISTIVKNHFIASSGVIKIFGDILEYRLMHSAEDCTVLNTDGVVVGNKTFEIVDAVEL